MSVPVAKGYTTIAEIQLYLGQPLTQEATDLMTVFIPSLEAYIDMQCRRSWLSGACVEEHWGPATLIYLNNPPALSVTSVTARMGMGTTPVALVQNTDWEVRSLENACIRVPTAGAYDMITVSYQASDVLPPEIRMLAGELGAMRARLLMEGTGLDVQSFSAGGEVQVSHFGGEYLPRHLQDVIDEYRFNNSY